MGQNRFFEASSSRENELLQTLFWTKKGTSAYKLLIHTIQLILTVRLKCGFISSAWNRKTSQFKWPLTSYRSSRLKYIFIYSFLRLLLPNIDETRFNSYVSLLLFELPRNRSINPFGSIKISERLKVQNLFCWILIHLIDSRALTWFDFPLDRAIYESSTGCF